MSDEKKLPESEELSLDEILQEVSSWDHSGEQVDTQPEEPVEQPEPVPPAPSEQDADAPEEEEGDASAADRRIVHIDFRRAAPAEEEGDAAPPGPAQQGSAKEASAADDGETPSAPPDNLIPFTPPTQNAAPPPEPDTILEAAKLGADKLSGWAKEKKESFHIPKVKSTPRERVAKPRVQHPLGPDTPPKEIESRCAKELPKLRRSSLLAFLLTAIVFLACLIEGLPALPLPAVLRETETLFYLSLGGTLLVLLCCHRLLLRGLRGLLRAALEPPTLALFATLFVLADGLSQHFYQLRDGGLPLFAPLCLILSFGLFGLCKQAEQLRICCRAATAVAAPDLLTAEPSQWNGKGVYRRRYGEPTGFGAQVQAPDSSRLFLRRASPFVLLLALAAGLVPALLLQQPKLIPWALSASFCAATGLSPLLIYALSSSALTRRLAKQGAALAGPPALQKAHSGYGLLVEQSDLFPTGSVQIKSYRCFAQHNAEYVISVTASLLKAAGSGLETEFFNLLRMEGGSYVGATQLELQAEGICAHVAGEQVLVGRLGYLAGHGIDIPLGVRVPTGVFCAIGGSFAGQFILEYHLHKRAAGGMNMLLRSRVTPVLIAVDFNLVPKVLTKLFHFPWNRMAFPDLSQRAKLGHTPQARESSLLAVLARQGLEPVATVTIGAQRLRRALRFSLSFYVLGLLLGLGLVSYLAAMAAFSSLSGLALSFYLLAWFLPTALIAGWVNQF